MSFETEKEINAALSVLSKNISKILLLLRDLEVKINDTRNDVKNILERIEEIENGK